MNHFVYLTTNLVNGKQYVGDHSSDNLNDGYLGSGIVIVKAIKKFGKEKFQREILEQFDSKNKAENSQQKYIEQFNTLVPNGYNISPTGGIHWGGVHSEESKQRMSESKKGISLNKKHKESLRKSMIGKNKGSSNGMWGKHISKENKQKLSLFHKGKKISEKTKKKISESHKGSNNPMFEKPAWDAINKIVKVCEYCGIETNVGNYVRWHGKKCKHRF